MNKLFITLFISLLIFISCTNSGKHSSIVGLKDIEITIDWLPVAEYYGFYYAKHSGIFKEYGYNVTIYNGTGAPDVASQVGTGNIIIGTSTSDNILKRYANGQQFSAIRRLFNFNPSSIVTLKKNKISKISDLQSKTLGVNIKASPYEQLMALVKNDRSVNLDRDSFREYPIEYGGAAQLLGNNVDAFLAYTTNQAIDVSLQEPEECVEIFLGDLGIYSYGLVIAFAEEKFLKEKGLDKNDVQNIIEAVIKGYEYGLKDVDNAVEYLKQNDPSLDVKKAKEGIMKIGKLNKTVIYPHKNIDKWLLNDKITDKKRNEILRLYTSIKWSED